MSLFRKLATFAKSPQGRMAINKAKKYYEDPKNKEKIDQVKNKITGKGKGKGY
ncbi:hypothetical protein [Parasphingorhabdus pacifica]